MRLAERGFTRLQGFAVACCGGALCFVLGWLAAGIAEQKSSMTTAETAAESAAVRVMPAKSNAAANASAGANRHAHDGAAAYALPNTFVHPLPDRRTGRPYEVWVDLPPSYFENDRVYPVVFTTDADFGFPLIRSLRRRVGARGQNIEDFVLVGLSYAVGESSMPSKRRDYTPTDPFARPDPPASSKAYARGDTYGQGDAYRDYIEREVFPLIAAHYRVDMARKIYIGHSLGGLFGSHVLLTRPEMFSHYILGSPSLWFDRRVIFETEAQFAREHEDLSAEVMLYIGEYETPGRGPRHMNSVDMVGDTRTFASKLESRRYPGLRLQVEVIPDEDHLTIFPRMVTRGLLRALPGHGPYTGS